MAVHDPRVVDLVGRDREGNYELVMIEENGWADREEFIAALQKKVNAYLAFITEGDLAANHPDSAGKKVTLRLDFMHAPDAVLEESLKSLAAAIQRLGFAFEWAVFDT
jgi:hypothetical protein